MLRFPNVFIVVLASSVALVAAAYVLGQGIASIRTADRTVQVRGSAEMPVQADLATWNLGLSASGSDLRVIQGDLNASLTAVRAFLTKYGITAEDIENQSLSVTDTAAQSYNNNPAGPRFTVSGGVTVRTSNLSGILKAKNALGELVGQGVILTSSYGPNYAFTKLNEAKPELVAQATKEARKAAEQFAQDSDARIGGIRRAQQGSVQILGRDGFIGESEQPNKVLRVVTTIDYDLN